MHSRDANGSPGCFSFALDLSASPVQDDSACGAFERTAPLLVSKEIVRPATYSYIDENTGLPAKYEVTPQEVQRLFNDGKAMLADGLSIPIPLEHQPGAVPQTKAQRAASALLNNAGWVADYHIKDIVENGETVERFYNRAI